MQSVLYLEGNDLLVHLVQDAVDGDQALLGAQTDNIREVEDGGVWIRWEGSEEGVAGLALGGGLGGDARPSECFGGLDSV